MLEYVYCTTYVSKATSLGRCEMRSVQQVDHIAVVHLMFICIKLKSSHLKKPVAATTFFSLACWHFIHIMLLCWNWWCTAQQSKPTLSSILSTSILSIFTQLRCFFLLMYLCRLNGCLAFFCLTASETELNTPDF